jgi:hypothetical protein
MKRVRTVEYEPGWGWIARNPYTGKDVIPDFVWRTRAVARTVVAECRMTTSPPAAPAEGDERC